MTRRFPEEERRAVFAGSFNPFTLGHLSVLRRGLELFDHVTVVIGVNDSKGADGAERESRLESVRRAVEGLEGVDVIFWSGLTVDAAHNCGARWLLRGVRNVADFEYERGMAEVNRMISGIDTVLLFAEPELAALSSSMVRELDKYGVDTSRFLPGGIPNNENTK